MDEERLQALLEEATIDCYDEEEEFMGILCTLDERLNFPLQARALGEPVEVVGLDESSSSLRRGIIAIIRKDNRAYPLALAELEFIDPDSFSAEWLAAYRYWLGEV